MTGFIAKAVGLSELEIDGDILVFDGEQLHRITGSGAEVWRSIKASTSIEGIVCHLQELHPGDRQVRTDVRAFIEDLIAQGLVNERPSPSDHFVLPAYVAWCSDDNGSALVSDLRSGSRFQLSSVAADIWTMAVVEGAPPDAVEEALAAKYPDAPDDLGPVITGLLGSLSESGLLHARMRAD